MTSTRIASALRNAGPLVLAAAGACLLGLTGSFVAAHPAEAQESGIRVTVELPDTVRFDQAATLQLSLADVALQDAPMRILATNQLVFAGKVRQLTVMLDTARADLGSCRPDQLSCAFQVRITEDGKLRFINDTSHPYKPGDREARVKVIAVQ